MGDYNHSFFKFMTDIIDSGCWAKLSPAARSLYPVLLKFSNDTYKHVWPKTETLLKLTGFKTKKSLQQAKKELAEIGLIDYNPGTGHTSTRYYFRFDYPGSKISPSSNNLSPPGVYSGNPPRETDIPPNNIQITITNKTENTEQLSVLKKMENLLETFIGSNQDKQNYIKTYLIQKYGDLEVGEAIKIAVTKGKNGDIHYLEGILKNRTKQESPKGQKSAASKSNGTDFLNDLRQNIPESLLIDFNQLRFHYKVGETLFFKTYALMGQDVICEITEIALALGKKIKILQAGSTRDFSLIKSS